MRAETLNVDDGAEKGRHGLGTRDQVEGSKARSIGGGFQLLN